MKRSDSLVFRLTGMVFILLLLTIGILLFLVNNQMDTHFYQYLQTYSRHGMEMRHGMMHGIAEQQYISSIHRSLLWVGLGMLIVSVGVSYIIVRKATKPLLALTEAAKTIQAGTFGQTVPVERLDEVGMLTQTFNEMSAALDKNETMRRHLFASVAHELRTPLAIIQGNLEGMIDDVIPADKKIFLSMEDEILRLGRLVQDLNDLSLAEINKLVLHKQEADLNMLLERAVNMLQPLFEEKHMVVKMNLCPHMPLLYIDTDRINQVIYNILNNAIRYIGDGDSISIETELVMRNDEEWVRTSIADTGQGIDPEDLPHIFQYFYRGEKSRSRKSGGSGIGLALARQFVVSHGGTIEADSTVGKGTTFTIYLPVRHDI